MATAEGPADVSARSRAVEEMAVAIVRERTGSSLVALILSGSHATGEAAWAEVEGRSRCLSDLDLYAVLADEPSCDRARSGERSAAQSARLDLAGVLGPMEVAYLTRSGLSRMPARPGTLTLREAGRVLTGDPGVLEHVPAHRPQDIGFEERLALLENRGAELLGADPARRPATGERAWLARHATLKGALELAGVLALEGGAWPTRAAERVDSALRRLDSRPPAAVAPAHALDAHRLAGLWRRALAWRSGAAALLPAAEAAAEWREVVQQWCAVWWRLVAPLQRPQADPWAAVRAVAARAPWPRRVRRALDFRPRAGDAGGRAAHLLRVHRGTPVHRLAGSITTLLFCASSAPHAPAVTAGALGVLADLGVTSANEWSAAAQETHARWSRWVAGVATPEPR